MYAHDHSPYFECKNSRLVENVPRLKSLHHLPKLLAFFNSASHCLSLSHSFSLSPPQQTSFHLSLPLLHKKREIVNFKKTPAYLASLKMGKISGKKATSNWQVYRNKKIKTCSWCNTKAHHALKIDAKGNRDHQKSNASKKDIN